MSYYSMLRACAKSLLSPPKLASGPFNFSLVSENPLILYSCTMGSLEHIETMADHLRNVQVTFLIGVWWDLARVDRALTLRRQLRRLLKRYPNVSIHFLCNTTQEVEILRRFAGVEASHVNHNCFIDEQVFDLSPVEKEYDAVYNGRLGAYKRLELAERVTNLCVVTSPMGAIDSTYSKEVQRRLAHAVWPNFMSGSYKRLEVGHVRRELNRARTGIVLSATEGACYASCEYLLCGVPVVSTPSRGGRDEIFTTETALIVDPTPEAVARGVSEMIERAPDPKRIRAITIEILKIHRERFFDLVDEIRHAAGTTSSIRDYWADIYINKLSVKCKSVDFPHLIEKEAFLRVVQQKRLASSSIEAFSK